MSGLIAIVGRPNVGKSALFNRIVKKRIAIVHDRPGVTRDRVTAEAEWEGRPFTLVDTGGIGLLRNEKSDDVIINAALEQVELAIESATLIILVVNVQEGVVPLDREVSEKLRRSGKPVLVAVNKVDNFRLEMGVPEFAALGFDKTFAVTAIHGGGVQDLMDEAVKFLPPAPEVCATEEEADAAAPETEGEAGAAPGDGPKKAAQPLKIAIVGRPNVGKSSIINALTGSTRVVVTPIAGTTRDAVDVPFEVVTEGVRSRYVLIDTAGLRKARRVDDTVEYFSTQRTEDAVQRSDIVVFVLDAEEGILEQDKKIGALITENKKACVLVVNKWDLFEDRVLAVRKKEIERRDSGKDKGAPQVQTTLQEFGGWVQDKLFFLDYAPVIFTSAKSGFHLDRLLEAIRYVGAQLQQKVPTGILNRTLRDAIEARQPVSDRGHQLKFFYASQVRQSPPTFLLFVNRDELFSPAYYKFLAARMRAAFGYEGCPVVLVPRARPKTIEPVRKFKAGATHKGPRRGLRQAEFEQRKWEERQAKHQAVAKPGTKGIRRGKAGGWGKGAKPAGKNSRRSR
ncbi:MAG: ribosome biogenesis GTPase Der [Verrucomicrobia bacterium]|nr:ribosome biogenesis GTPase Der [Verrucomicrobiota bacterium]